MPGAPANQLSLIEPSLEAFHATFRAARTEPFHSWFPYLEGYSPAFVESMRLRYMPSARRILEPFAGTGTTALTLAKEGVECGYCEANPVMRFVISAKLEAARAPAERRAAIA